ncbi:MAG: RnfABCDGE type electron transport complex subunit D [Candidatus Bipolaricaulota bacterium]|nr:RnfABCDGE type electron transport complex subunit D [Candidatus Bipolaricaulota bacterium]
MDNNKLLVLSPSPHLRGKNSIKKDMYLVIFALLFPTAGAVYFFGLYVLLMLAVSLLAAVLTEYVAKMMRRRPFSLDGSAIVTAILFVLVMPPRTPLWIVVVGSVFSIAVAKEMFGGLGHNIFNPALAARAFVTVSFAGALSRWIAPVHSMLADGVTTATPLSESFAYTLSKTEMYKSLFFGNVGGSVGETSALLILIGGLILIAFRVIKWHVPVFYIGTVALLSWALGQDPLFQILAGGLFLGAFFMATDYVTTPITIRGKIIFATGAGVLVVLIRVYGSMPEGVCYSILLMNAFTPLIDRHVRPKVFGLVKKTKKEAA